MSFDDLPGRVAQLLPQYMKEYVVVGSKLYSQFNK